MPMISDSLVCSGELPKRLPTAFSPGKYCFASEALTTTTLGAFGCRSAASKFRPLSRGIFSVSKNSGRTDITHISRPLLPFAGRPWMYMSLVLVLPDRNACADQLTERTPGSARIASAVSRKNWPERAGSYPLSLGFTLNSSRFCVLKPTSTLRRFWIVRRNSPAPMSSTSEMRDLRDEQPAAQPRAPARLTLRPVSFIDDGEIHARRAQRRDQAERRRP